MNLAILGAGKVGAAIGRTALRAGHSVSIAGSGDPADISLLITVLTPGATAATAEDAIRDADIVILSIPSPKFRTLDPDLLAGRIVVDAMNYWPDTDGLVPELLNEDGSSSVIAEYLRGARLVKTLNHIGYHDLETDGQPEGASDRRALAVVSDDADAASRVGTLINSFGYDAVIAAPLRAGVALEPGTPIFSGPLAQAAVAGRLEEAGGVVSQQVRPDTEGVFAPGR